MKVIKAGVAGTLESSDISVSIEPNSNKGLEIKLKSSVEKQFGEQIYKVIKNTLLELDIEDALVTANDKGALDCVIKSRVQTAAYRAADSKDYRW
jgi:citrate lyase subunit gamma (acyl carrier protein)